MTDLIKLPSYEWFLGLMGFGGKGNTYAGSYGPDPTSAVSEGRHSDTGHGSKRTGMMKSNSKLFIISAMTATMKPIKRI